MKYLQRLIARIIARIWLSERLYHSLPWAAVVVGALGMLTPIVTFVFYLSGSTLAYGSFILGLRLAWYGCGEV